MNYNPTQNTGELPGPCSIINSSF